VTRVPFAVALARCADTLEVLNARTDSGDKAAWTVADVQHSAGSFAAEDHTEGKCPVCRETVLASDIGNIVLHRDPLGRTCIASGYAFYVAVCS
jgi:hypothetical protein